MARGRMLNKTVSLSMKFAALPDDTCRLLATWTIPQLDCHGVFYADPATVRSLIFPMREDITTATIEQYITAMESVGLIRLFTAQGRRWQEWSGFADNQVGLRADRESSDFPDPLQYADTPPDNAGNLPESIRQVAGKLPAEGEYEVEVEGKVKENRTADAVAPPAPVPESPSKPKDGKRAKPRNLLFDAVAEVTASNPKLLGSRIAKCAGELSKINATPEQVRQVAAWYSANDWRGRKGEKLTFATLTEVWDLGIRNEQVIPNGHSPPSRKQQTPAERAYQRGQIQDSTEAEREIAREQAKQRIAAREAYKREQRHE